MITMKIGLVAMTGFYPIGNGGPPVASYEMTKWLSKLGHKLLVLIPVKEPSQTKRIDPMKGVTFKFVTTKRIQMPIEMLSMLKSFHKECQLVHYNAPPVSLDVFWPLLLKLCKKPQTYYYWGDVHNYPFRFSIFKANQRFLDKIIVTCNFIYTLLRQVEIPSHKLAYIPYGIDVERFDSARPMKLEGDPTILYVGRLHRDKDVATLFRAFSLVQKALPGSCLHIVGSGLEEVEAAHKSFSKKLGIFENTIWHGSKPNLELAPYYKGCDIVVYPVFQRFSNTMGLVMMEAMAAGKPVVTTDIPSIKEFLHDGKNVLLHPLGDHEALARRVIELSHDKRLAERISRNGYRFIQDFDWRKVIIRLDELFQECVLAK